MKNISETTHIFTSCTNNYIPKARVLGKTLKHFHPNIKFHLVLSDVIYEKIKIENEPFDSIITVEELGIPNLKQWIFKHTVIEMCTAVKGIAFLEIIKRYNCENVIFFDPDIAIFSPLDELLENFNHSSILLTPHQLKPEKSKEAIIDNEICFLRHGTFNLGFLGVKNTEEGINFLQWWSHRCLNFCYDDTPNALFTDQKWIDLVPSFFPNLSILYHPGYNVANWNLTNRQLIGDFDTNISVNGQPLVFYHFSNSQGIIPQKYDVINDTVALLLNWYKQECQKMGQEELSKISCFYNYFDNGELITHQQRLIYRDRSDLQEKYSNPFNNKNNTKSYYNWYLKYHIEQQTIETNKSEFINLKEELEKSLALIEGMESSKFWKIRQNWFALKKLIGIEES